MQRLDRNWADLLQELRVVQTGVQLLTGFLLTLPFQARFEQLSGYERTIYLITVALSVAATGFLIAPVSLHRILFRRHARELMVTVSHRLAIVGLVLLGAAIVGVVLLIFDVVAGTATGIVAAAAALVLLVSLWAGVPWVAGRATLHRSVPIPDGDRYARLGGPAGKPSTRVARSRGDAENVAMGKNLSTKDRKKLSNKSFALPGKRKYPIPDKAHARNALARVAQNGTPAEQKKVKAAVKKRFPSIGKKKKKS